MRTFYQLKVKDDKAELYIYGDVTSEKWQDSDVTAMDIIQKLQSVTAKNIDVYINSYGGEVAQGIAIYNALKRHTAKVTTYVDGFACSIASVIAMAGDVRKMYSNSLLMIHNAWTFACGNVSELEKAAEDLKVINEATKKAYLEVVNISENELTAMLDAETWITAEKAVEMGFATEVIPEKKTEKASANAQNAIIAMLTKAAQADPEPNKDPEPEPEKKPEPETDTEKFESVIADLTARVEKIEKEVFKQDKKDPEPEPEKKPEPEAKNKPFVFNFLNAIQK